jgi:hypothetical protein
MVVGRNAASQKNQVNQVEHGGVKTPSEGMRSSAAAPGVVLGDQRGAVR